MEFSLGLSLLSQTSTLAVIGELSFAARRSTRFASGNRIAMSSVRQGMLVTCDPTIKEYLLYLDKNEMSFIFEDLDETHLFIDPTKKDWIQEKIDKLHEDNAFKPVK